MNESYSLPPGPDKHPSGQPEHPEHPICLHAVAVGDGTRYALTLASDPDGGWLVIWPPQGFVARVTHHGFTVLSKGRLSSLDLRNIALAARARLAWLPDPDGDLPLALQVRP